MPRSGLPALAIALLLAALPAAFGVWAQEEGAATPAPPAVAIEPVGGGVVPPLLAAEAGVRLDRASFEPGSRLAVPAADRSLLMVAVEAGSLSVRSSAPLVIERAAPSGSAGPVARELVAAGAEAALGVGDAFVRPLGSEQDLSNPGGAPAAALLASVAPDLVAADPAVEGTPGAGRGGAGLVVALAVVVVPECPAGYDPAEIHPAATPGGGGGGGGGGGVAMAVAAAPECVGPSAGDGGGAPAPTGTPTP